MVERLPGAGAWGTQELTARSWLRSREGGKVLLGNVCEVSQPARQKLWGEKAASLAKPTPPFVLLLLSL